jgi:lipopolysaccharide export system permease protein
VGVLSRYLLLRFVAAFAAVLAALVAIVAVVEVLADFGDLAGSAGGFADALVLVALRIPREQLPLLIPIAAFAGAFLSIGTAARAYEVVGMKAGGVSPLGALLPVLLASVAISAVALVLNETLAVRAHEAERRHAGGDEAELTFRRGSFWYHKGHMIYNVRDADPQARVLREVAIFELDERGRLVRSIHAAAATIGADGSWELSDAVLRSFDPLDAAAPPTYERLSQTALPLPEEEALFDAGVNDLSIRELREYRDEREPGDTESVRAQALLHERISEPLASLLFVVLAVPLGLRVERTRSLAVPALQGVAAIFAFTMARKYGTTLAIGGVTSAVATPWVILAGFLVYGAVELWRAPR